MYFLSLLSIILDQRALRLACRSDPSYFTTSETLRTGKRVLQLRVHEAHGCNSH